MCLSECLSDVPFSCNLFWGLSLAITSHDQFKASDWSTLFHYNFFFFLLFFAQKPLGGDGGDGDWEGEGVIIYFFSFLFCKSPLAASAAIAAGRDIKKML